HGSLIFFYNSRELCFAALVHVPRFTADEGFVNFDTLVSPTEFRGVKLVLHRKPQPLKHEPCRLLRNTQRAMKFHAGHAVLAVAEHPKSSHPLIEADGGIFENRSHFQRELFLAALAKPDQARLDETMFFPATARANHLAVREAKIDGEHKSSLRIGEVNDGLLKCPRLFHIRNSR